VVALDEEVVPVSVRRVLLLGSAVLGVVALRGTSTRRALRRSGRSLAGSLRYARGRLRGVAYRLRRRHPAEDVPDLVLADRVRSALGSMQRRLDLPHIHVMVHDRVAILHGDVSDDSAREALEEAVLEVAGVRGVESFLHVGLLPSDTRPSQGRDRYQPSQARTRLEAAALRAGAPAPGAGAVRAVLGAFCERIPETERGQLFAHLPADVRSLAAPARRHGADAPRVRTVEELTARVAAADAELDASRVRAVIAAVLGELRSLVPEERSDVAAVLPRELRDLWERPGGDVAREVVGDA
jgi:uncharacterized protein (DUF2267 family)